MFTAAQIQPVVDFASSLVCYFTKKKRKEKNSCRTVNLQNYENSYIALKLLYVVSFSHRDKVVVLFSLTIKYFFSVSRLALQLYLQ